MPLNIPDQFVNVDFPSQPQFTFGDTGSAVLRFFGPAFEDVFWNEIIPANEWRPLIEQIDASDTGLERLVVEVKDQKNEGACVGNMATQGLQVLDALEHGRDSVVLLSAISCYRQIGSSPNSGAMISDALDCITTTGVLPLDTPENRQAFGQSVAPATGFNSLPKPSAWSAEWKATAKKFRLDEAYTVKTFEGLMTALLRGWPVGVGRQGHSILYLRPALKNGNLGVIYVNSWGSWGFGTSDHPSGFGFDTEQLVRQSSAWAFCFRSLIQRGV